MCMSQDPPEDKSGEIARKQEMERQALIKQGAAAIDKEFLPFDDKYYAKVGEDYGSFYTPQLETQYEKALRKGKLSLARTGNLGSSSGNRQLADLKEAYDLNRTTIADKGLAATNDARSRMEVARQQLLQQNRAAADPAGAGSAAAASAAGLRAPPAYDPLGDIFASMMASFSNAAQLESVGYPGYRTGMFLSPGKERINY